MRVQRFSADTNRNEKREMLWSYTDWDYRNKKWWQIFINGMANCKTSNIPREQTSISGCIIPPEFMLLTHICSLCLQMVSSDLKSPPWWRTSIDSPVMWDPRFWKIWNMRNETHLWCIPLFWGMKVHALLGDS